MINTRYRFVLLMALFVICGSFTAALAQSQETRKFDEYGELRTKDENARLKNLVIEMKSDSKITAYILAYGGRRSGPKDALTKANKAKGYTLKTGKFKTSRVIAMDGGYKEEPTIEIWLVPAGADAPQASPSVDPSEVVPAKVVKKSGKKPVVKKTKTKRS